MAKPIDPGTVCRTCGHKNVTDAERCAACGAELEAVIEPSSTRFIDGDPALRYVDPTNRTEVTRFERWDEGELACGFLRSNGIACELSSMVLPGLPGELILWVNTADADLAWALLADANREAFRKDK